MEMFTLKMERPSIGGKMWPNLGVTSWSVLGFHSYYDPERGAWIDLGTSYATDCNLSEW